MLYNINEIFYSIQGEGFWTGRPGVFIRFSGCNLNCNFCDTEHKRYTEMDIATILMVASVASSSHKGIPIPMIVLTGGEPTIQNLFPLVEELIKKGWYIALETNGTNPGMIPRPIQHVTVSPKYGTDYSNWFFPDKIAELKVVLDPRIDPKIFRQRFNAFWYYIQPMSENFEPAINYVKENPEWTLSIQLQKLIGIK